MDNKKKNQWQDAKLLLLLYIASTSDLQPSAVISNQLPGQVVSKQIRTIGYKFIIVLSLLTVFSIHCMNSDLTFYITWPALLEQSLPIGSTSP